jgi:hypothetical protein
MVLAIPGGTWLFSVLQEVLKKKCNQGQMVRLTQPAHQVLRDFRWLVEDLAWCPARIIEIILHKRPDNFGAQDTAATGMGGVHFVPRDNGTVQPLL